MTGFADLHCHMLCSVDDGADSVEEMLKMLSQSYNDGVRSICFTPHYSPYIELPDATQVLRTFERIKEFAREEYPDLNLFLGNEIMYHNDLPSSIKTGLCRTLNSTRYVLVEFNFSANFETIFQGLIQIIGYGYIPILAHVERYFSISKDQKRLYELIDRGILLQMNADSVTGKCGKPIAAICKKMLKANCIDIIASDCHSSTSRTPHLSECFDLVSNLCSAEYATAIMCQTPLEILENKYVREY